MDLAQPRLSPKERAEIAASLTTPGGKAPHVIVAPELPFFLGASDGKWAPVSAAPRNPGMGRGRLQIVADLGANRYIPGALVLCNPKHVQAFVDSECGGDWTVFGDPLRTRAMLLTIKRLGTRSAEPPKRFQRTLQSISRKNTLHNERLSRSSIKKTCKPSATSFRPSSSSKTLRRISPRACPTPGPSFQCLVPLHEDGQDTEVVGGCQVLPELGTIIRTPPGDLLPV